MNKILVFYFLIFFYRIELQCNSTFRNVELHYSIIVNFFEIVGFYKSGCVGGGGGWAFMLIFSYIWHMSFPM